MMDSANVSISTKSIQNEESKRYNKNIMYSIIFNKDTREKYYKKFYEKFAELISKNTTSTRLKICVENLKKETNSTIQHALIFFVFAHLNECELPGEDRAFFMKHAQALLHGEYIGLVDYVYSMRNKVIMRPSPSS